MKKAGNKEKIKNRIDEEELDEDDKELFWHSNLAVCLSLLYASLGIIAVRFFDFPLVLFVIFLGFFIFVIISRIIIISRMYRISK